MAITKVFKNGNSQAIRIPNEMRTDRKEFIIKQVGEAYIMYPVDDPWLPLRQVIGTFPEEFMEDREQPSWDSINEREAL
jgi:antitoxin VapB